MHATAMDHAGKPNSPQRRRALVTAVVLGAMAVGIYVVFVLKIVSRA